MIWTFKILLRGLNRKIKSDSLIENQSVKVVQNPESV